MPHIYPPSLLFHFYKWIYLSLSYICHQFQRYSIQINNSSPYKSLCMCIEILLHASYKIQALYFRIYRHTHYYYDHKTTYLDISLSINSDRDNQHIWKLKCSNSFHVICKWIYHLYIKSLHGIHHNEMWVVPKCFYFKSINN